MTYYDRRNDRRHTLAIILMIAVAATILWAMPAGAQTRPPQPTRTPTSRIQRRVITPDGGRMDRMRWEGCRRYPSECPTVVSATPTPHPRRRR